MEHLYFLPHSGGVQCSPSSSISGQPVSAPTTPTTAGAAGGSAAYAALFPTSLTIHSFVSLHQYCCPSADQSSQQDREEGDDEGAHQFCCSASGCSSPSSR
ncbi:hypothetical protein INR49_011641 [Caranx melampygus]|nr:hypothetical protein INR49_011641 [Caranx melampygus]